MAELPDDIHSDCLADLNTKERALSIWEVDDKKQNLEEVMCALATARERLQDLDIVLFPFELPPEVCSAEKHNDQATACPRADSTWHHNLSGLTGKRLLILANFILKKAEFRKTLPKSAVKQLIQKAVSEKWVDSERLKPALKKEVLGE